jgi:hypothetical protein
MKEIRLDCDGSAREYGQTGTDRNANPDGQVTEYPWLMVNRSPVTRRLVCSAI